MTPKGIMPVDQYYEGIYRERSGLLNAFMLETGLKVQEIEMHYDILGKAGVIWFEKKKENKYE